MHSRGRFASSIVILNGDVVTGNPIHSISQTFYARSFVVSFARFYFRFYLVYFDRLFVCLFVCLMSVQMKNTLIKTTETFIVRLFLINLLCILW